MSPSTLSPPINQTLIKFLTLYNYTYIRPDRPSETLYHADLARILNCTAIYTKRRRPELRAA